MNDSNAKQQIVDKVKESSNILVTVSRNPSVDELSAALGLTILLNKMKKHATAVFSGDIPPAITFLDPEKTFENTVDSLRDFIIALDKEKADHLRYKVDGDVVKIFITPYRTTITSDDLDFSQGDYNVELVLGLGVKSQDDLDQALAAHGRILHDATVVTMTVGETHSELGSVDWHEQNASSLSEMLVSLSDGLKTDRGLLDEQIATAFLTGIVAATDRFSNNRTSSKAMTISAQLMSAGANQQLIASKLEEAHEIGSGSNQSNGDGGSDSNASGDGVNSDGTTDLSEGESTKLNNQQPKSKKAAKKPKDDGSLVISHEKEGSVDEVAQKTAEESQQEAAKIAEEELQKQARAVPAAKQDEATHAAEQKLAKELAAVAPAASSAATPSVADLQKDIAAANAETEQAAAAAAPTAAPAPLTNAVGTDQWQDSKEEPSMGGTLNATTEQAAEDKRRALEDERNHTILTHGTGNNYVGDSSPTFQSPLNATVQQSEYETPSVDPFSQVTTPAAGEQAAPTAYAPSVQPPAPSETLADLDAQNRAPHEEARAAVNAAFDALPPVSAAQNPVEPQPQPSQPAAPAAQPAPTLPPLPPMPDFSTLPPLPPMETTSQPSGALPPEKLEEVLGSAPVTPPPAAPQSNDPGQFRIPGQS